LSSIGRSNHAQRFGDRDIDPSVLRDLIDQGAASCCAPLLSLQLLGECAEIKGVPRGLRRMVK